MQENDEKNPSNYSTAGAAVYLLSAIEMGRPMIEIDETKKQKLVNHMIELFTGIMIFLLFYLIVVMITG